MGVFHVSGGYLPSGKRRRGGIKRAYMSCYVTKGSLHIFHSGRMLPIEPIVSEGYAADVFRLPVIAVNFLEY
jgi:hypothetical protein